MNGKRQIKNKYEKYIKKTVMTQRDGTGREGGSGWGTHVYLWQIHFDLWQNQYNIVKLNKIKFKKKRKKRENCRKKIRVKTHHLLEKINPATSLCLHYNHEME